MSKTILLSVARVDFNGNTGEGKYFYSFSPQTIFVHGKNEVFKVKFTERTSASFEIVNLITSDAESQMKEPKIQPGKREIHANNHNSKKQMINVSIIVRDKENNKLINCDPQVLNDPDPQRA